MFDEEHHLGHTKSCSLKSARRVYEIDDAAIRSKVQNAQGPSDMQPSFPGCANAIPFVEQQQVGLKGFCKCNSSGFAVVKAGDLWQT